jgi:hypothetical protein
MHRTLLLVVESTVDLAEGWEYALLYEANEWVSPQEAAWCVFLPVRRHSKRVIELRPIR